MKALQVVKYGDIDSSLAFNDIPKPKVSANQVLIQVKAASINPIDRMILAGQLKKYRKCNLPFTLGYDVSGIIVDKGSNVEDLSLGDEVYSRVPTNQPGTFAEFVAVDSDVVFTMPTNVNFSQAAALPLVGLTVIQAMRKAGLKKDDRILIHAGSGGVGSIGIQYAKSKGAYVYTTTSTGNIEWVKSLGADRVIDYKKEDYKAVARDLDIVFNSLGDTYSLDAFDLLKKGGKVNSITGSIDNETAKEMGLNFFVRMILAIQAKNIVKKAKTSSTSYRFTAMDPTKKDLKLLTSLVEEGKLKPIVGKEYSFENAIEAIKFQSEGHSRGKVIINF